MKLIRRWQLAGFALMAALAACADSPGGVVGPNAALGEAQLREAGGAFDQRAELAKIGRLVAMSLGDKKMRHSLKKDLRAAPFREHKLELRTYLQSADGKELLSDMAAKGGYTTDALLTAVGQIRSVELYMPVRKHRESWIGDGEVLVAVQLEQKDPIVGFDAHGQQVPLNASNAPEQATVSIVGSETRFDKPMLMNAVNVGDLAGQSIGTLMPVRYRAAQVEECTECGGGGGGGGGEYVPPGLYMEFSRIIDYHEPWTRGDPEIEVHIHGPNDQNNPKLGKDLSCSGESVYDYRKAFDQNDAFWQDRVLLFSQEEITAYASNFSDGFHLLFWEDDDTACALKLDSNTLLETLKATSSATGVAAVKIIPQVKWWVLAGSFLAVLFDDPASWLLSNDDFLGAAVPKENGNFAFPAETTHAIMNGVNLNGRATIIYR